MDNVIQTCLLGTLLAFTCQTTSAKDSALPTQNQTASVATQLVSAAVSGDIELVSNLIEKGADVNSYDSAGDFPLYAAVIGDHAEIVEYLIKKGANVNQAKAADVLPMEEQNTTALHAACTVGSQKCVELLLNADADANPFANITEDSAHKLDVSMRRIANIDFKVLAKAMKPDQLDKMKKRLEMVKRTQTLLQMGFGFTPLTLAAQFGRTNIAVLLLEHGADVNFQKNNNNYTALIQAAISGNRDFIEFLLNRKANPTLMGPFGNALA